MPLAKFTSDVTVKDEVAVLFFDNDPETLVRGFFAGWERPQELYDLTQQAPGQPRRSARTCGRRRNNSPWTMFRG